MVFEADAEDLYSCEILGICDESRNPYEVCRALVKRMQHDLPGELKKIEIGVNGNRSDGYCLADLFGRRTHNTALYKAYPFFDENENKQKIRVVYPGRLGPDYLREFTGLKGNTWKRRA
jgi:hypothetical protein